MARKPKHEEHENHERWLISYADFITLLFAFFVVMYSVSSVNEGKYRVLSEALVASFRSPAKSVLPVQIGTPAKSPPRDNFSARQTPTAIMVPNIPVPKPKRPLATSDQTQDRAKGQGKRGNIASGEDGATTERVLKVIAREIEQAMSELIADGLVTVRRNPRAVEVEINTNVLFPPGSATLSTAARKVVVELADVLQKFPHSIHVEGFTDDVPISSAVFPSNWELSAGRAASVVHLFTDAGIQPARLVAIAYGQYRPVADNATPEGRTKNRRVLLVIQAASGAEALSGALSDYRGQAEAGSATLPTEPEVASAKPEVGPVNLAGTDSQRGEKRPAPPLQVIDLPIVSPFAGGVISTLGKKSH
ncbi:MAG: flagellar motor protein MotD [Porticoccaceae bacterium]